MHTVGGIEICLGIYLAFGFLVQVRGTKDFIQGVHIITPLSPVEGSINIERQVASLFHK